MALGVAWGDRDVLKGLAVGVLLIAAMTGLFFYERAQFGEYPVEWTPTAASTYEDGGTLAAQESATFTFDITDGNLLRVVALVAWSDDVGDPDSFTVQLTGPEGTGSATSPESDAGEVTASVTVNEAPDTDTAPGRDPGDAADQARAFHASSAGQGTWTVVVTLVSAPGQALPGAGAEVTPDGTNDFTLTVTAEAYEPTVANERV